jgi:DNA (cytosine-5)-methyltransferase 1
MGYHQAGFTDIVGIDVEPQPRYPFHFIQADALSSPVRLEDFDLIHASPPCQAHTQMSARWRNQGTKADTWPDLLTPTREWFHDLETPWVIENVPGAIHLMEPTVTLHGGMFGLGVNRPRHFETNWLLLVYPARRTVKPIGVYGKPDGRHVYRYRNNGNYNGKSVIRTWKTIEEGRRLLEVPWMTESQEIADAVPPAYTRYIGEQFLNANHVIRD